MTFPAAQFSSTFADVTGDSFKLAQQAAARPDAVVVIDATPGVEVVADRVAAIVRATLQSHGWSVAHAPE